MQKLSNRKKLRSFLTKKYCETKTCCKNRQLWEEISKKFLPRFLSPPHKLENSPQALPSGCSSELKPQTRTKNSVVFMSVLQCLFVKVATFGEGGVCLRQTAMKNYASKCNYFWGVQQEVNIKYLVKRKGAVLVF